MTTENVRALENAIMFMIRGFYESDMISRNEIVQILNNLNVRIVEDLSHSSTKAEA
jgi:hypothetical protein